MARMPPSTSLRANIDYLIINSPCEEPATIGAGQWSKRQAKFGVFSSSMTQLKGEANG